MPLYLRRLFILLLIGTAHTFFLWYGDILHFYALLGFFLILFRKSSDKILLALGVAFAAVIPVLVHLARALMPATAGPDASAAVPDASAEEIKFAAFTSGSYLSILYQNVIFEINDVWRNGFFLVLLPHVFGKFLLGFYAGRRRLLQDAPRHLAFYRKLLRWGLFFGVAGNAVWVLTKILTDTKTLGESSVWVMIAQAPIYFGMLAMAAFYLSALTLLFQRPRWRKLLSRLAPVGRLALTNYLMQTVVNLFVFYGIGLGLMGKVGAAFCVLMSAGIFVFQIVFSNWWLERFRFGPAEWLWRSLTYGKPQAMRPAARPVSGMEEINN